MTTPLLKPFMHDGKIIMLAFDHRGSFKKAMERVHSVDDEEIVNLKKLVLEAAADAVSGVLIDQEYGLPAYRALGMRAPFLLPMEKTGYTDAEGERVTELQYDAASIVEAGALGAKLLLYTNPHVPSWKKQMETAKAAIADSSDKNLPLFLEFVLYEARGVEPGTVVENVARAIEEGLRPDVWKVAYPGSREACRELTRIAGGTPWIVLTGGDSFPVFENHFREACEEGAAGCLAGRALWSEACELYEDPASLRAFLDSTFKERLHALRDISSRSK